MQDIRDIAVIGTGIMGAPMAARLAEAGFPVRAWNRSAEKASILVEKGVEPVATAGAAVAQADVVLCMLSSGPVCDEVLHGASGVISAMKPGAVLLVMSSIPVDSARQQAEAAKAHGVAYVDAPVSGGEKGAIEGTLAIMAGGEQRDVDALRPLFDCLGRVTHVGPVGCGSLAKLANQTDRGFNDLRRRGGPHPCRRGRSRPGEGAAGFAWWLCRFHRLPPARKTHG